MIWHPLFLSALASAITATALLLAAASTAFRVVVGWTPTSADRAQIALESRADVAVLQARWALGLYVFSSALFILGLTNAFVELIPGAMCGTGVLQAMGPSGKSFLLLDGLLLGVLLFWNTLESLNRSRTDYPLVVACARTLLLALPAALLAVINLGRAAAAVDTHQPVDCCAVVYDQFRNAEQAQGIWGISDGIWLWALALLSFTLCGLSLLNRRRAPAAAFKWNALLAAAAVIWVPLAAAALINILSAYHYGVLQHECPWCLFLPQHGAVGFPLFGALAVVAFEGPSAYLLPVVARRHERMISDALQRSRIAAGRVFLALMTFLLLTGLPPLVWRLRFGVWIGG